MTAISVGCNWSAKALVEAPDLVLELHREFIDAGARMIITNTYSTIPHYLAKEGLAERYVEYTEIAADLARQAANHSVHDVRVLGSIPPLSESYRADLVPPRSEAEPIYRDLVEALEPYVDVLICETMSSVAESLNATAAAMAYGAGKPIYLSWTLSESASGELRSGESIAEAFAAVAELPLDAYFVNCTTPEAMIPALKELRSLTDKPLGCYPNRVAEVPAGWTLDNDIQSVRRTDLDATYFVEQMRTCIQAGATLVGGCCGIGPSYNNALRENLGY